MELFVLLAVYDIVAVSTLTCGMALLTKKTVICPPIIKLRPKNVEYCKACCQQNIEEMLYLATCV